MAFCVVFVLLAGIFNFINKYVYISIIIILSESLILFIFKWKCPLTIVAQKYTDNRKENFDIFLPEFLAKHNKTIFTTLFLTGSMLLLARNFLN